MLSALVLSVEMLRVAVEEKTAVARLNGTPIPAAVGVYCPFMARKVGRTCERLVATLDRAGMFQTCFRGR